MKKSNQSKSPLNLKKKLCCALLVCALAFTCGAAVACRDDTDSTGDPGSSSAVENVTLEVGEYYYDADGVEYLLTIQENGLYAYAAGEVGYTGGYTVSGNTVSFTGSLMTAEVEDGVIVLTVDGVSMRFLKKVNYTVTFTSNGETVHTESVLNGKKLAKPADPELEGYQFIGWYTDAAFKSAFRFDSSVVTSEVTLYARWAESNEDGYEYTVSFDCNYEGAELAPASQQTVGGKIYDLNLPTPSEREGYEFKGWWVSMYEDATKLSYEYSEEVTLEKDTTLYALWVSTEQTTKLASPIVHINGDTLTWNGVENVSRYVVNVTGPDGFTTVDEKITKTEYDLGLSTAPAGDYVITVTAEAAVANNTSDATVIYYKNKALTAVTRFDVVGEATLKFNPVANAQKYLLTIDCGEPQHNHVDIDNGASTTYDFSNCEMLSDGIVFTVKAVADGYTMSVSNEYVLVRNLEAVTGLTINDNETVSWNAVENAEEYVVTVKTPTKTETFNVEATSFDLKTYGAVGLRIEVYPYARGYNSPAPRSIRYNKESIATPASLTLNGEKLVWDKVEGATKYIVKIGDNTYETETNSLVLVKDTHYTEAQESCDISVIAIGATEAKNSEYSDIVTVRFGTMSADALSYVKGELIWASVINVQKYEVKVNDNESFEVEATENKTPVTLDKAGVNTLQIRCYDLSGEPSEWVSIDVTAYTVSFDTDGGDRVATQYMAEGDPIKLPESYRSGYELLGWYDAPNGASTGATRYAQGAAFAGGNTTMYACWKGKQYTVTYDYVGKEVPADAPIAGSATYNQAFTLDAPVSTEGDVAFIGWFSEPGGRGTQYTDKDGKGLAEWTTPGDIKVFAYWATIFTFTLNPADGTYNVSMGPDLKLTKSITEITIPTTYKGVKVRTVESYAFDNCQYLTKINIPDTIEVIETDTAFYRCKRLEEVSIYHVEGNFGEKFYSDDNGVLIYKDNVTGYMTLAFVPLAKTGAFTIPAGVTEVPLKVFASSLFSEITIPETVTVIRESAFYNCQNLTTVTFEAAQSESAQLSVEAKAFENCTKLETVTLPAHLTEVSINMFSGCSNLANINMAAGSLLYTSKDGVLCEDNGTKLVICPVGKTGEFTIPSGISVIGTGSFAGCNKLTKVIIPAVVTTIEEGAFRDLGNLREVDFNGGAITAQTIGEYAFYGCKNLGTVNFDQNCYVNTIGKYAFAETGLGNLTIPGKMATVGDYAFANCKLLGTVNIADAIGDTKLAFGNYVFQNCTGITVFNLPASVQELALAVFDGCSNLQNVFVADDSEYFSDINGVLFNKAKTELWFYPIGRMGDYVIPDTVEKIMPNVFKNNTNLGSITIGAKITNIGDNAFNGCSSLTKIIIEDADNTLNLGTYAFANCIALKSIELPKRISDLSEYLFYGSSALNSVEIKGDVKTIAKYAFAATGLTQIVLPATATSIGDYAFTGSDIVQVEIPANVALGTYVFKDCKSLETVTFADGFAGTTIPAGTFQNSSLVSIEIPTSITKIDTDAFNAATNLTSVTYEDNTSKLTTIGNTAFYKCAALTSFWIPDSVTSLGTQSLAECTELTTVTVGTTTETTDAATGETVTKVSSKLKTIGSKAFQKSGLTSFYVPETVTTIDTYAFDNCTKLTQVTFSQATGSDLTIKQRAFYGTGIQGELNLPARLSSLQTYYTGSGTSKVNDAYVYEIFMTSTGITALNVAEGCANYTSIDGVIYSADETIVWIAPEGKEGDIVIPNTVTNVKSNAFYNCKAITSVTFEELAEGATGELVIGSYDPGTTAYDVSKGKSFYGCSSMKTLSLPQHLTYIGYYTFAYTSFLESLSVPASVTDIGKNAFYCSGIHSLTFEKNADNSRALKTIGSSAFSYCSYLQTVEIPKELISLESSLFANTSGGLESVTFEAMTAAEGSQLTTINSMVFSEAGTSENALVLPDTVNSMDKYSTSGVMFGSITIPAGVTTLPELGRGEFQNIYIAEDHETYKSVDGVVYSKDGGENYGETLMFVPAARTSFVIPEGVKTISKNCFQFSYIENLTIAGSVIDIGSGTFFYSNLQSVTFEYGTEDLVMPDAFQSSYLKEITVPYRVTNMGSLAFKGCEDLETVIFEDTEERPSRLTSFGLGAFTYSGTNVAYYEGFFEDCTSLKKVVLPSQLETIGAAFQACESLEEVVLPDTLTAIPAATFMGSTNLKKVTVSKDLTSIGEHAFQDTALTTMVISGEEAVDGEVHIPGSVTELGKGAFCCATGMSKVVFGEGCDISYIGDYTFSGCTSLKEVNLPKTVETIGKYAFGNKKQTFQANGNLNSVSACDSPALLESVNIPADVVSIGEGAFYGCESLAGEDLPTALTELGDYAFYGCKSLTEINVPGSVVRVGAHAFGGCSDITSLTLYEGITELGDYAFEYCSSVIDLYIPGSIVNVGLNPFLGWTGVLGAELDATNVSVWLEDGVLYNTEKTKILAYLGDGSEPFVVPESVKQIAPGAFAGSKISSITFHDGISEIPDRMFENCSNLKSIELSDGIRSIGVSAFQGSALESIYIGKNINMINDYAFADCAALSKVEFAMDGLETLPLGKYAFANCTALTEITIPRRVSSFFVLGTNGRYTSGYGIGQYCFAGCTNLETVNFDTTGAKKEGVNQFSLTIDAYAFQDCTSLVSIHFPETLGYIVPDGIYKSGSYWYMADGARITLLSTSGAVAFGSGVFKNCTNLEEVTFTNPHFIGLGMSMFENCTSLKRFNVAEGEEDCINIPKSVTSMSSSAVFKNCTSLTKINLPETITSIGSELLMNTAITEIELPANITSIGKGAFQGCKYLKSVDVPAKVTTIYEYAFMDCTALESVTLHEGLQWLGYASVMPTVWEGFVFANCTNIKEITIPSTVRYVLAGAFSGWTSEQTIKVVGLTKPGDYWYLYEGIEWYLGCEANVIWGC